MRTTLVCIFLGVLLAVWMIPGAAAADEKAKTDKKVEKATDANKASIKTRFLLQGQALVNSTGNPAGDGWGTDFMLRRARVILAGNVNKWIHFFVETDNPNFGKNGDWSGRTFIQDAYVDLRFFPWLKIAGGLILLPFSHMNRQGATSLNTMDYHNLFSGKFVADFVWRDVGIEARGIIADMVDYRIGIFNGLRGNTVAKNATNPEDFAALNPDDWPRFTGRVAINFFDVEDAFFYSGTYLGKKKILSLGFGMDIQPDATLDDQGNLATYMAFSSDIFLDMPLNNEMGISGQVGFVYFNRGHVQDSATTCCNFGADKLASVESITYKTDTYAAHSGSGMGAYGDLAFRWGIFQPTFGMEWFNSDLAGSDILNIRGGLTMYMKGHRANLKLEYANLGKEDAASGDFDRSSQITLQAQFLY